MKCPGPEPGEERHQPGKSNQEPVDPYAIRYLWWEWTQHRKVISPRDIGIRSAEHRRLSPHSAETPPRDGFDQRSGPLWGAPASRSLSPKTVVCVYVHNCCAFSHERLTLVSPGLSNLFQRAPAYGTLYPCLTSIASSPSSQIGSMVYSATGKPWRPALPDDRSSTDAPPEHGSTSTTPCTRSTRLRQRGTGK